MNMTIRTRLTVLYGGAFFLAGAVLITMMYLQMKQAVGQQLILKSFIAGAPGGAAPHADIRFRLQMPAGAAQPGDLPFPKAGDHSVQGLTEFADVQNQMRTARIAVMNQVLWVSILSLVGVGILACFFGWLMAGQVLRPLRQISTTVRGIADRNLHQRVAMKGPQDEIRDLADTLDDMLERLDRAFDSQQRFIANASHELRTPLAINRTLIEVAMLKEARPEAPLSQLGSTLLAVNQRHERLIDGLLMLASSEQEIAEPREVELAEIAQHVLTESATAAQETGVDLRMHCESAPCRGDPVLLERLMQNLVDNAIRYNLPQGGWLSVATGTDARGQAFITVENPGAVIASYEVPRLFEPFRRLSSTERQAETPGSPGRRGAGLGLSIVRAIVTSHGGSVNATPREGGGLVIHILLPTGKT